MADFGALQEIITSVNTKLSENNKLLVTLAVFVFVNLIATVLDIFFQFRLKNKEKGINKHNIRETKRVDVQEALYNMLEELTYYDGNNPSQYYSKISLINKYLTQKRLYLTKDLVKIAQNYNDYFLTVLSDYRNKNYQKEIDYLEEFSNIFNHD